MFLLWNGSRLSRTQLRRGRGLRTQGHLEVPDVMSALKLFRWSVSSELGEGSREALAPSVVVPLERRQRHWELQMLSPHTSVLCQEINNSGKYLHLKPKHFDNNCSC